MKRKGLIALLIVALLLTLAGCGKDKKQPGGDSAEETPNQTETRTEQDAGAQTAPEDGQSGEVDSGEAELPVQSGTDGAGDGNTGDTGSGNSDSGNDTGNDGTENPSGDTGEVVVHPDGSIEMPPVPLK